jgi:hypothetical protein
MKECGVLKLKRNDVRRKIFKPASSRANIRLTPESRAAARITSKYGRIALGFHDDIVLASMYMRCRILADSLEAAPSSLFLYSLYR